MTPRMAAKRVRTIGVFAQDQFGTRWTETVFSETGPYSYLIRRYRNGESGGMPPIAVSRALTWREAARWAGKLATLQVRGWVSARVTVAGVEGWQRDIIAAAMQDPESATGVMGRFLRRLEDDEELLLMAECYRGFRSKAGVADFGELAQTLRRLGMRPRSLAKLCAFAGDPGWRRYAELGEAVLDRKLELLIAELGREDRAPRPEEFALVNECRPALRLEQRVWLFRAFVRTEPWPGGDKVADLLLWILGDAADAVFARVGESEWMRAFVTAFLQQAGKHSRDLLFPRFAYNPYIRASHSRWVRAGKRVEGAARAIGMEIPAELAVPDVN